ncbi:nitrous oxide reductase family maturation protein NosD [Frigidibacter sp. ROC022]|uniref:nitrous oxide reductase family maturation protein NosD n=1 Tax=Frigidibacter sp. ROC022 TaxID=2971796 RepID=UPI00215AF6AD|nr:nitrous oxide reductase family maturation protein NosD [Frigidibacter sp. ROC022]MCR8726120.1 nitrous oxide reductase family maturation protein NosD [Frigidibacter sp. ROC022]
MRLRLAWTGCLILAASAAAGEDIRVPATAGALTQAVARARPGDVLILADGLHAGPVLIDRPMTLTDTGDAHVVGPGEGTVIRVTAPGVTIRGLDIENSGIRLDRLDSGIALDKTARGAVIEDNRLTGNLIGIDVQGAHDVVVRGNTIRGRDDLRVPERGPGIYVWNAPGLLVEDNDISLGRDGVFVTTSNKAVYRNNRFSDLRYAFHSMYSNELEVTGNVSTGNGMGYAFMYSTRLIVTGNLSQGDRSHGFFMNFANKAVLEHNEVRDGGEKCLFVYNSNRDIFRFNRFQGCGIGIHFTAGSQDDVLTGNAFEGNRTQVKYVGSRWLEWSEEGTGNYWSDHVGFDIDGDGRADSPYRPNDAVDQLLWTQPMAKLLLGAPAMQLVSWSQSRFPGLLPGGIVDSAPLLAPGVAGLEGGRG